MPRKRKVAKKKANLKLSDVMCPICLCIIIEPVTLPCDHELCKNCLEESVEKTTRNCPVCRARISSWARKAVKENKLVNEKRWNLIKSAFPQHVKNRMDNLDSTIEKEEYPSIIQPKISSPGSIRKEFEMKLKEHEKKLKEEQEAERLASEKLIHRIQLEDMRTTRFKEKSLKQDEELAKRVYLNLNNVNLPNEKCETDIVLGKSCDYTYSSSFGSKLSHLQLPSTSFKAFSSCSNELSPVFCSTPTKGLKMNDDKENTPNSSFHKDHMKDFTSTPNTSKFNVFSSIKSKNNYGKRKRNCYDSDQEQADLALAQELQAQFNQEKLPTQQIKRRYSLRNKKPKKVM